MLPDVFDELFILDDEVELVELDALLEFELFDEDDDDEFLEEVELLDLFELFELDFDELFDGVSKLSNENTLFKLERENLYPIGKYFSDLQINETHR